jgi:general secretion pathway protein G
MNKFQHLAAKRRSDEGFTLIELLMVIVIMGILAGIVVFSVKGINDRGEASACKTEVSTVQTAEESAYAQDETYYDLAGLTSHHFLRAGTPKYVADASATDGSLTMVSGAPCTAG